MSWETFGGPSRPLSPVAENVPPTPPPSPCTEPILIQKHIEQTYDRIPLNIDDLQARPPDGEEWQCYLVPAAQWEESNWIQIKHLHPIHVVRKTPDDEFFVVALADSCVQRIRKCGLGFKPVLEADIKYHGSEFSAAESMVYGIPGATERYRRQFIRNARSGINSRCGRGLGRLYQRTTLDEEMQAVIHWAVLVTDILEMDEETRDRLFVSVLFCCLHVVGNLTHSSALDLIQRKPEIWHKFFQELYMIKTARPAEDPRAEMHQVSLLRGLCGFAGGALDDLQHAFNTNLSTNDNMSILGDLFQLDFVKPLTIDKFRTGEVEDTLLQQQHFQVTREMLDGLQGISLRLGRKRSNGCEETMLVEVDKGLKDDNWGHGKEILENVESVDGVLQSGSGPGACAFLCYI